MVLYLLFEAAFGYGLFQVEESEEIGLTLDSVQESVTTLDRFGKVVKLVAFVPFKSALHALENMNCVAEGILHEYLQNFLAQNMPAAKNVKKAKFALGVAEHKIGAAIADTLSIPCRSDEVTRDLLRGVRLHFPKFIKALKDGDLEKAQLGLGHSYSRGKVKFNVNRADNMIIQAIALLDQLDKDINTFAMRMREWYSYHFPELIKVVPDNYMYARVVKLIKSRSTIRDEMVDEIEAIVMDSAVAKEIVHAAKQSMGMDLSDMDMVNIELFADRVVALADYRRKLHGYLERKMDLVAPNLAKLIGELVGARLISHAGSLTNLAKYPASTVQILGAEKALFRALKTKGNTPKYGLIFHSTFIGRAGAKNKGRISRYLANKCSIASRIDCFSDGGPSSLFGEKLRGQVEERLQFYETGNAPRKNIDVMKEVISTIKKEKGAVAAAITEAKAKPSKRKRGAAKESEEPVSLPESETRTKRKKVEKVAQAVLPAKESAAVKKAKTKTKK